MEQMELANAKPEKGLYVGLRLDGRVRASGVGSPPLERFVKELAPVEGENVCHLIALLGPRNSEVYCAVPWF